MNTKNQLHALQKEGPSKAFERTGKEYYADGMSRQLAKETAMLMAIRQGYGLIRRNLEVHSIHPNGESRLVCVASNLDEVWHRVHYTLKTKQVENEKRRGYRMLYAGHHPTGACEED